MGAAKFFLSFLVKLAILPKHIHLIIYLLGVERSKLLPQLLQAHGRLYVRHKVEYMYLCGTKCDCFHILCFYAAKIYIIVQSAK